MEVVEVGIIGIDVIEVGTIVSLNYMNSNNFQSTHSI